SIVDSLGARVQHVVVNNVNDQTFYAKIVMTTENRQVEVDAAPSDAIALAMRSHVPIYVEGAVLEKAGIVSPR
ncbi:MAG: bifunctional nuclease family protein, partial [Chloroflexi bacterium]|nr:bifunctional nuclease family protein [Chloroflexota bacterium]